MSGIGRPAASSQGKAGAGQRYKQRLCRFEPYQPYQIGKIMNIDKDSFASGQIGSKIWLAENLEKVVTQQGNMPLRILCLGGWYGTINFILQCRNNLNIEKYRSIDIDDRVEEIADTINNLWVWKEWRFKAVTADANSFQYSIDDFNVVINTSVEHMESNQWFNNIPKGCYVVLQSNNMDHEDHFHNHQSLAEMVDEYPMDQVLYADEMEFKYPEWEFKRFMIIGKK